MDIPYAALMMFALAGLSIVLILIILLQRGRGGGLAGAFGGAGGQSALGTRAGDVFTKITIGLAVAWIVLACVDIYVLKGATEKFEEAPNAGAATISPAAPEAGTTGGNEIPVLPADADAETDVEGADPVGEEDDVDPFEATEGDPVLPGDE
ncbi:preprotein translocase subunit SecG [Alienimonas chondri]|uniref:Protein-export membrane protein SecG n=1 Tax=Alienimonas chondri TaxID=2681879 RepID=A0ABX1VAT3_9PLAN|nr:preprotein translocase subunit SecG [Alienimonas chondri]NNJ24473.1 hypothetical protein [Alienimonas chondri]